jgi:beta-lactamase class A
MKAKLLGLWVRVSSWVQSHKKAVLITVAFIMGATIFGQLLYPSQRLLPFASVNNKAVGHWTKNDAANYLNYEYSRQNIDLYFGNNSAPRNSVKPSDIGITTSVSDQVNSLGYPWYLRLIPGSLLWAHAATRSVEPTYSYDESKRSAFIQEKLGGACSIEPVNASLKASGNKLELIPASAGGTCNITDVEKELSRVQPQISASTSIKIAMQEIPAKVSDAEAQATAETINRQAQAGLTIKSGDKEFKPDTATILSWLEFYPSEDNKLLARVNVDKANDYFTKNLAPPISKPAGITQVTTRDFTEIARVPGQVGQSLDAGATGQSISNYLQSDSKDTVTAVARLAQPKVVYTRTYTPTSTGLGALMNAFAQDNAGTYGIQLTEIGGSGRQAGYNQSKQFTAASTYKIFVAFGAIKKIEAGEWQWSDQVVNGKNISTCFQEMIVQSNNECAKALLFKYDYNRLTADIQAQGVSGASGFPGGNPKATAADLNLFMAKLERNQLPISGANRNLLLDAMKRNVYRKGIPAGVNATVADKVGFIDGLLHDTALVYSPTGTYALTILSDGSSWAKIAELTRQLEALRNQ